MGFEKFRKECEKLAGKYKNLLEIPPKGMADLALPCFSIAKGENPTETAKELAGKMEILKDSLIDRVEAVGPYVNFHLNNKLFSKFVLNDIKKTGSKYGSSKSKKTIMIEYCHANTHKAFHVGHVRNICLGESICRILEFAGHKIVRSNYQGDVGPHVAKCLWGYQNLGLEEPEEGKGKWLGDVYAMANDKITGNKELGEMIATMTKELYEKKSKILLELWNKTRKWSLDYLGSIYKDFNVNFDRLYFESEVYEPGTEKVKELLKNGTAKMSEGAVIVDLKELGVFLLLKSDGTPLYSTKDLGLAQLEFGEYKLDKCIHVVGVEQKLYFKQLFKTFGLYDKELAKKSEHMCYEHVALSTGKISSRTGQVVVYDDLKDDLMTRAIDETKKRHETWSEAQLEDVSKKIAMAALKYDMLKVDINTKITFDPEKAISFEGDTGPYLQYTYARANSILKKSKKKPKGGTLEDEKEIELIKKLSLFHSIVKDAASALKPNLVAHHVFELATLFNEYYHSTKVIGSKKESERLTMVEAVKAVLGIGLTLLGIDILEEM